MERKRLFEAGDTVATVTLYGRILCETSPFTYEKSDFIHITYPNVLTTVFIPVRIPPL